VSRSKKKPVWTDQNRGKPGYGLAKRKANRKVRAKGKLALKAPSREIASGKAYRKVSESYDIRDWSFYSPTDRKVRRK
jgi:hypothetical protein